MTSMTPTLAEIGVDLKALRRYEIDLKNGVLKTDGTTTDH